VLEITIYHSRVTCSSTYLSLWKQKNLATEEFYLTVLNFLPWRAMQQKFYCHDI